MHGFRTFAYAALCGRDASALSVTASSPSLPLPLASPLPESMAKVLSGGSKLHTLGLATLVYGEAAWASPWLPLFLKAVAGSPSVRVAVVGSPGPNATLRKMWPAGVRHVHGVV